MVDRISFGKKILLVGDVHADKHFIQFASYVAEKFNCGSIIQLGDFLYTSWNDSSYHKLFSDSKVPWFAIDGNHDNVKDVDNCILESDTPIQVCENLTYLPRGYVCINSDTNERFVFMGGAYSMDRKARKEGVSYWSHEAPSERAWRRLGNAFKYEHTTKLFSHESPGRKGLYLDSNVQNSISMADVVRASNDLRFALGELCKEFDVDMAFHGHHHQKSHGKVIDAPTYAFGLSDGSRPGALCVIGHSSEGFVDYNITFRRDGVVDYALAG